MDSGIKGKKTPTGQSWEQAAQKGRSGGPKPFGGLAAPLTQKIIAFASDHGFFGGPFFGEKENGPNTRGGGGTTSPRGGKVSYGKGNHKRPDRGELFANLGLLANRGLARALKTWPLFDPKTKTRGNGAPKKLGGGGGGGGQNAATPGAGTKGRCSDRGSPPKA